MDKLVITAVERPFTLVGHNSGWHLPLTSVEVQRLLDTTPIVMATTNAVVLAPANSEGVTLVPATRGGGPAFVIQPQWSVCRHCDRRIRRDINSHVWRTTDDLVTCQERGKKQRHVPQ